MGLKRGEPALLIDPLGIVGKQHRIAVEGDAQLAAVRPPRPTREDTGGGKTGLQRTAHVLGMGGEK